jgi:hypothetical protein
MITTFWFRIHLKLRPSDFTKRSPVTGDPLDNSGPDKISSEKALGPVRTLSIILYAATNVCGLVANSGARVATGKLACIRHHVCTLKEFCFKSRWDSEFCCFGKWLIG